MIDLIKAELQQNTYSGTDQEVLDQLKAIEITEAGDLDAGGKVKLLSLAPSLQARLSAGTSDSTPIAFGSINTTIGAICTAALKNIESQSDDTKLRMQDPQTVLMISALTSAGILTQTDNDALTLLSSVTTKPFEFATERDVAEARGGTNSISLPWVGQNYLKLSVSDFASLTSVAPMVTISNDVFDNAPLGRTVTVTGNGNFIVDLTGLSHRIVGSTVLKVEMWVQCSFSAVLI